MDNIRVIFSKGDKEWVGTRTDLFFDVLNDVIRTYSKFASKNNGVKVSWRPSVFENLITTKQRAFDKNDQKHIITCLKTVFKISDKSIKETTEADNEDYYLLVLCDKKEWARSLIKFLQSNDETMFVNVMEGY